MLFYNKDLFDAAGVAYPAGDMTWEEYEKLAEKMTFVKDGTAVYGTHHHTWICLLYTSESQTLCRNCWLRIPELWRMLRR